MSSVLRHLRRAALLHDGGGLTDAQLLERFLGRHDEAAFEALVYRHGPMVLSVCRRVLRHQQDAEDAFQATFLVLARRAAALRSRELLGNWLYGVAYRTALKARTMNARRRARELRAGIKPAAEAPAQDSWEDLLPLLDQELSQLPDKYRVPVVLCDLEGRTRREVAAQLKVPEGTLSGRLTTARRLLARRLARYGLAVSGGALAVALSEKAASAAVTGALASSTARAAVLVTAVQGLTAGAVPARVVALAEGVVKSMFLMKLRAVVAVALVVCAGAGVVGMSYPTTAAEPGKTAGAPTTGGAAQAAADDLEALRLEVGALRRELRATREEVRSLAAEVRVHKGGPMPEQPGADTTPLPGDAGAPVLRKYGRPRTAPAPETRPGGAGATETAPAPQLRWSAIPGTRPEKPGGDPLAEAEAALKKLKERPDDKEAAGALEKALQRLKERVKPDTVPGQPQRR